MEQKVTVTTKKKGFFGNNDRSNIEFIK
jgi:hypothetical protein